MARPSSKVALSDAIWLKLEKEKKHVLFMTHEQPAIPCGGIFLQLEMHRLAPVERLQLLNAHFTKKPAGWLFL